MHFTLVAVGSRGDVEPLLSLGLGLHTAGHGVRLAALAPFQALVESQGLRFASLGELPRRFTRPTRQAKVPKFRGARGRALFWIAYTALLRGRLAAFRAVCDGSDAIVFGGLAFPVIHVAEALGLPCFRASPVPHTKTQEFCDPFFAHSVFVSSITGRSHWRRRVNRFTYDIEDQLRLQCTAHVLNRWRRDTLKLPTVPRHELAAHARRVVTAELYGCSHHLVPRPSDWRASVHLTGSWRLPDDPTWSPPCRLQTFLAQGLPPVYVGFGSMSGRDPARLGMLVVEALVLAGQRGLIADLDLDPGALPTGITTVGAVPHRWLFPRMSLVVHHGGAGTLTAVIEAGVPSVVVPMAYDQWFWAKRLQLCGLARSPVAFRVLSAARLAATILETLNDSDIREKATGLKAMLSAEDGVARAVDILQHSR